MKQSTLTQAVLTGLTALTLTACGSSDNDTMIYGVSETAPTTIVPAPITTTQAPNFVELAKQAGLNDANAQLFAETVKHMTVDSQDYKNALEQAIKAQQADNAIKDGISIDPVSKTVDTANPFINGVDVSKVATVSSNHYVRQTGSNYERTANPEAMAGLGGVATDDPTTSNPWLSNYVLGVEAIRDADGTVRVLAVDSTGEMAVGVNDGLASGVAPINANNPNEGIKVGAKEAYVPGNVPVLTPPAPPYVITQGNNNPKSTPYYAKNGLIYKTQRRDGQIGDYNYTDGVGGVTSGGANGNQGFVTTLQMQNRWHRGEATQKVAEDALYIAKNQTPFNHTPAGYVVEEFSYDHATGYGLKRQTYPTGLPNLSGNYPVRAGTIPTDRGADGLFGQHFSVDLIVYNTKSKPVGHSKGKALGYKVPIYGKEENVYQLNEQTGKLEVINGVDIQSMRTGNAHSSWYTGRYGAWEMLRSRNNAGLITQFIADDNGELRPNNDLSLLISGTGTASKFIGRQVANNDNVRIYGKNFLALEAGAEGEQLTNNTYTGKYNSDGTMTRIAPAKLHQVQYGRITNNIDTLTVNEAQKGKDEARLIFRQFQAHGAPNTVDTYFYRGTNHTTLDAMSAIKARGGTYRYHGHALTYNLGPYVNTAPVGSGSIPTAYGSAVNMSAGSTVGNFVEATFDAGKGTVTGSIYNFLNKDNSNKDQDFKKQNLATFAGDVYGNTVVGTSAKVGTNEVGSFTGSFFGKGASELGGNISSISREQGYGDAKWGAVFGATRGTGIDNYSIIEQK